jgi:phosphopantetheinyl transferase (holo-ACP synthase)
VALAHFEADRVPKDNEATDALDLQEHYNAQRRLVYVGRVLLSLSHTHQAAIAIAVLSAV